MAEMIWNQYKSGIGTGKYSCYSVGSVFLYFVLSIYYDTAENTNTVLQKYVVVCIR
jgi:hypothetical protein